MSVLSEIVIDKKDFPRVIIAGEEYELLCQYIMAGKNSKDVNVYFDSDLSVTIELKDNTSSEVIYDLFTLRDISKLIEFIEMTLSPKEGIITYSREDFPKYVMSAMEKGGYFPNLYKDKMLFDDLSNYTGKQPSFMEKIHNKLLQKENLKKLQNDIEKHLVPVIYIDAENAKETYNNQKPCEVYNRPSHVPSSLLPEGWNWVQWNDGSGYLCNPNEEIYFEYDLCTIPGGVEYKESSEYQWNSFDGDFNEYKKFAETIVLSQYLSMGEKDCVKISHDEVFSNLTISEQEKYLKALEHYNLAAGIDIENDYVKKYARELISCYEANNSLIDFDFWTRYEELTGEKITYNEYLYIDSMYDGDPHDVKENDTSVISTFKENLKVCRSEASCAGKLSLDEKIKSAAGQTETLKSANPAIDDKEHSR